MHRLTRFWSGTGLVPSSFLNSISWFLFLTEGLLNGHVLDCSTTRRGAAEMYEMSAYRTVPCLAKMTQHSSTADWVKFK